MSSFRDRSPDYDRGRSYRDDDYKGRDYNDDRQGPQDRPLDSAPKVWQGKSGSAEESCHTQSFELCKLNSGAVLDRCLWATCLTTLRRATSGAILSHAAP
jgi:hypothetical protein